MPSISQDHVLVLFDCRYICEYIEFVVHSQTFQRDPNGDLSFVHKAYSNCLDINDVTTSALYSPAVPHIYYICDISMQITLIIYR